MHRVNRAADIGPLPVVASMALLITALPVSDAAVLRGDDLLPDTLTPTAAIDRYIGETLAARGVTAAPAADPYTLARRLTLDLAGRIPTLDEVERFVDDLRSGRPTRCADELIASHWYNHHAAAELNTLLRGVGGTGPDLSDYTFAAVAENRPWDQMFRELLGAVPAADRPERFVLGRLRDHDLLTRDVSSIYFGINISCAQCHTHPYQDTLTQDYFFGMKSFFARSYEFEGRLLERRFSRTLKYTPVGEEDRQAAVMFLTGDRVAPPPPDVPDLSKAIEEEQRRIDALRKKYVAAKRKDPQAVPEIPPDADYPLRAQMAAIALSGANRPLFARAMVNRMWYRFFGYGLVMRVDQMHSDNRGSHPELLAWLARDFIAHGFDLRRLTSGIVASRAYRRTTRWVGPAPPAELFAVARLRPLTPSQMGISLLFVGRGAPPLGEIPPEPLPGRIRELARKAGETFAGVFDQPYNGMQFNVSEALAVSNDPQQLGAIGADLVSQLMGLQEPRRQIEKAVLSVLGRPAEIEEVSWMEDYLADREDRRGGLRQIIWALCASSEFRFNH
ncbi:MAG: hypothetical protein CMJ59_05585 [Planctomycetaceae bacterium]|nr:hypothetical protein [Planctomycetaceae bacterium]